MIDETDRHLTTWIGRILDQATVSLSPPAATEAGKGVGLYLLELLQSQPPRGTRRPPLLMTLRYLITTHAPEPEDAHQMLGTLVVAALENSEFEVEQEPLPLALWNALGVAPRPSFVLRVPFRVERPEKLAPLVRQPLIIKQLPLRSFAGRVLGPDDIPIMNARVELPALDLFTSTDSKGRFHFASIPDAPGSREVRVRAKGQEFSINTEQVETANEPLVIHLKLEG
jgi:hypothetical protein